MAKTATLTLHLDEHVVTALEAVARHSDQSPSAVAVEALEAFVEHEARIVEGILRARAQARQGEGVSHDEAMEALRAEVRRAVGERAA